MARADRSRWSELHLELARILWEEWDPIGVNAYPQTADEYDRYVDGLVEVLTAGGSVEAVASYLWDVQRNRMGVQLPAYWNCQVAAIACAEAYRTFNRSGGG